MQETWCVIVLLLNVQHHDFSELGSMIFIITYFHNTQLLERCKESMKTMSRMAELYSFKYDFICAIIMGDLSLDGIKIEHEYFSRIFGKVLHPSWCCELWDGYDSVLCHLTTHADLLVEYAKGLRKLVARYEPVKKKKKK